jgi:hypothetical protein
MKIKKQIKGKRIKTFFAWLPITVYIGDYSITKWLEKVTVEEEYIEGYISILGEYSHSYWKPINFL